MSYELDLFPAQGAFFLDKARYVAAVTGVGAGKSYVGAVKLLQYVIENPGAACFVTAPSFPLLRDATLETIRSTWPVEMVKEFRPSEMKIEVPNGAVVMLRSTDDPELLRAVNLACVWMDEAALSKGEAFKVLQGRIRQPGYPHQMWITTTPKGYNWVFDEFKRKPRPDYSLHHWTTRDNPHLDKGYEKDLRASYSPEFARQELEGEFAPVSGSAYFRYEALRRMLEALPLLDVIAPGQKERGGLVTRYRKAAVGGRYVIGLDTAWGKTGSYSCGHLAKFETMEEVVRIHGRPDLDELAQVVYELHREYNRAYICAEWAGDEDEGQVVVRRLEEMGCGPWMYYRDGDAGREKPGFVTDGTTRPYILAMMEEAVRNGEFVPRSPEDIHEMMGFVRDEKGRPSAAPGLKDDAVMSWAFTLFARQHAVFGEAQVVSVRSHIR